MNNTAEQLKDQRIRLCQKMDLKLIDCDRLLSNGGGGQKVGLSTAEQREHKQLKQEIDNLKAEIEDVMAQEDRHVENPGSMALASPLSDEAQRAAELGIATQGCGQWFNAATGRGVPVFGKGDSIADYYSKLNPTLPHGRSLEIGKLCVGVTAKSAAATNFAKAELRALGEGVNTSGGFLVPEILSGSFIDNARAKSKVFEAGAKMFPMESEEVTIARVSADANFTMTSENTALTESDTAFDQVRLVSKKIGVLTRASIELAEDAPNFNEILTTTLISAWTAELDRQLIQGDAAGELAGLTSNQGISTTSASGSLTYAHLITGIQNILSANYEPNAILLHPQHWEDLAGAQDDQGQTLAIPPMFEDLNIRILVSSNVPTTECVIGDFTRLLVGMRMTPRLEISNDRFFDQAQVAYRLMWRGDSVVENSGAFYTIDAIS